MSGFDMFATLNWYRQNLGQLGQLLPRATDQPPPTPVVSLDNPDGLGHALSLELVNGVLAIFPPSARERMTVGKVTTKPPLWFHRDSVGEKPVVTELVAEAISPTAIVPSHVLHAAASNVWCGFDTSVGLFRIGEAVEEDVRLVVHLQGLTHELAHSIVTPELHADCVLRFEDGREVPALTFFTEFHNLANSCPPISHYASAYTDAAGQLIAGLTPLNEALVECITAHLLGFAFRLDGTGLDPFAGREALHQAVIAYLNAKRVSP